MYQNHHIFRIGQERNQTSGADGLLPEGGDPQPDGVALHPLRRVAGGELLSGLVRQNGLLGAGSVQIIRIRNLHLPKHVWHFEVWRFKFTFIFFVTQIHIYILVANRNQFTNKL